MMKRLGLVVAGVAVGIVLTGVLLEQEERRQREQEGGENVQHNGRFAEVEGNTVRMYEVKDGHFCGYTDTKVFEDQNQAVEWVVKETDAKIVIKEG